MVRALGEDVIRGVILDVLSGRNLRDSTEMLTRKRIASLNVATLVMFLRGQALSSDFIDRLTIEARDGLKGRHSKENRWILQWVLGLTDKAYQNVLRDKPELLDDYTNKFNQIYKEIATTSTKEYGVISGQASLGGNHNARLDWSFIIHLLGTIGAQTLAIRGSEKSTYGKLFERLILGSLLHILGFKFISPDKPEKTTRVFWLTSRQEKRESDATALFKAGKGLRFDIGFIGRGNPEISLDKVSRFEREIDFGRSHWYMATIIIVDRIPPNSRIPELAKRIKANVIQMSLAYWPKQVARVLARTVGLKHPLVDMPDAKIGQYLSEQIAAVPFELFLPAGRINNAEEEEADENNTENEVL